MSLLQTHLSQTHFFGRTYCEKSQKIREKFKEEVSRSLWYRKTQGRLLRRVVSSSWKLIFII